MTIISNNCAAVGLYEDLNMEFDSPTIALQIFPEDFTKFCLDLQRYMDCELREVKTLDDKNMEKFLRLFKQQPYFPLGMVDDIVICFQHYETFDEAREKWYRRRERIDYNHIGYMMVLNHPYVKEAEEFGNSGLKNAVLCTNGYDINVPIEHHEFKLVENQEFLQRAENGKRIYEQGFDAKEYARRL